MKSKEKFFDTNILIRYFTKDDEKKAYEEGINEIYSYDGDFDNLVGVKRVLP